MSRTLFAILIMGALLAGYPAGADSFEDGLAAYNHGDYATALKFWRPLADQGIRRDQYNMGVLYAFGQGVIKDDKEAVKWFRLAADQGYMQAQARLGSMYTTGQGVARDDAEGFKWLRLAAAQGDATSQNNIGVLYEKGQSVAKDAQEAMKWYRLAAEQGDATAQSNLGYLYLRGDKIKQDNIEALVWFKKAAAQGSRDAQKALGFMYATGAGVPQDYVEAVHWTRLAAEQGQAEAQHNLAAMYLDGHGVGQNREEAVKWLTKAAAQGYEPSKSALNNLAQDRAARLPAVPPQSRSSNIELLPEIIFDDAAFGANAEHCHAWTSPTQAKEYLVFLTGAIIFTAKANAEIRSNIESALRTVPASRAAQVRADIDGQMINPNNERLKHWQQCRESIARSLGMTDDDVQELYDFNTIKPSYAQLFQNLGDQAANAQQLDFAPLLALTDRAETIHAIDLELVELNSRIKKDKEVVAGNSQWKETDRKLLDLHTRLRDALQPLRQSISTHARAPQERVGPSFDCGAPTVGTQPLAQIICSSVELARAELSYVMAYQTLRQGEDANGQRVLNAEANTFVEETASRCNLPKAGSLKSTPSADEISCIKRQLEAERAKLLQRLRDDALEEARLTPEQAIAIQQGLKRKGFLANNAVVDGLFGPVTRTAIAGWQRSVGLGATGFASLNMLADLGRGATEENMPLMEPIREGTAAVVQTQSPSAAAIPSPAESRATFSQQDIPKIVETSRTNELRFNRDYKGRFFRAVMILYNVSESTFTKGEYRISLKSDAGDGLDCRISDPGVLNTVVDWIKGQKIEVLGVIENTVVGDLQLSNCTLTAR